MRRLISLALLLIALSLLAACGKSNQQSQAQPESNQAQSAQPQQATPPPNAPALGAETAQQSPVTPAPSPGPKRSSRQRPTTAEEKPAAAQTVTVPAGTVVNVRVNEPLSSKTSQAGERFTGVIAEPVEIGDSVVIPKGADATGEVTEAVPLGRFKGGAKLGIALRTVTINGRTYKVEAAPVERTAKGKGKRTGTMVGGGAGLGALIGGLAGGGKGAAIGAITGAGAGGAGAAFTGNKDIVIPSESVLSFKLSQPVSVK